MKTLVSFLLTHFEFGFVSPVGDGDGKNAPYQPVHPGFDGARAGIGIFPPKRDVDVFVKVCVQK